MDERRRDIEREHSRGAGGPGVDVAALAERVRRGEVQPDAIRVAALLGEARARDVVPAGVKVEPGDLLAVVSALKASPVPVIARAAIAVARVCVRPEEVTSQAVLRAAQTWVLCPCKEHDAALDEVGGSLGAQPMYELTLIKGWSKKALSRMVAWSQELALAPADVLAALRADLVPWLLGEGDPVHARSGVPGQAAPLPPETIALRDPPPPPPVRPAAPPPALVTDPESERAVESMIEEQGARSRRVLRGGAAPPGPAEIVTETFTKLAEHRGLAGCGFALKSAGPRGAVIARTQGEWTEALHFTGSGSVDVVNGLRAVARPKPAVLSNGKLAAWRQAHGSRSKEPEVMTQVPLRLATEWDIADPLEANRFIDEVVGRVTKIVLPRLARLRDPEDMLHELLDLTRGPRGFSVADVEALTCLAGRDAPREYVRRWRVKDPRHEDLAEVVARLGL